MPGLTGVQLAGRIRAEWPDLPVLLATGYADLPSGTDADLKRLYKPFGQDTLSRAVVQSLRRGLDRSKAVPFRPKHG